jgi:hypothetical protein
MSTCNGFKLRGLNSAINRVSVKSNVQTTWSPTYKKPGAKTPASYEVAMMQNELIILKCEDGAEIAVIEITPLGDAAGTMIVESSRKATRTLRVGTKYRWEVDPGENLICRTSTIVHPTGPGAGLRM